MKTSCASASAKQSNIHESVAFALLVLIGFQLLGEILSRTLSMPLPGPVIGMFLLMAVIAYRRRGATMDEDIAPAALARTSNALIANMGLLFVPAGVGILAETDLLGHAWLPIIVGVIGSTLLSLIVTGLVMHHMNRRGP